jgi:tRNA-uridine 2-sulfurtransferase
MSNTNPKVILGMSGGVDSSVAAALLQQQGFQVIGVNLVMLPEKCDVLRLDACCGSQAVTDARAVCDQIGIPFYCINRRDEFLSGVIDYFCSEYKSARTPNPCVVCNHSIKFPELLRKADELEAEYIATGHFANIVHDPEGGRYTLHKGTDEKKDQTYYLFGLDQKTLSRTIFPLGKMLKDQVRNLAVEMGLKVHGKPESQEICFVPGDRYSEFLESWVPEDLVEGAIIDKDGRELGRHKGIQYFTIGQRRGTGVAQGKPVYVIDIDEKTNTVVVGDNSDLMHDRMNVTDIIWCNGTPDDDEISATVKVRYNHPGALATIKISRGNEAEVVFDPPERAITSGQAAVFYDGDIVLGGGWITR